MLFVASLTLLLCPSFFRGLCSLYPLALLIHTVFFKCYPHMPGVNLSVNGPEVVEIYGTYTQFFKEAKVIPKLPTF